jgi:hypothetical protein
LDCNVGDGPLNSCFILFLFRNCLLQVEDLYSKGPGTLSIGFFHGNYGPSLALQLT